MHDELERLEKQYPEIHPSIRLKTDLLHKGVRPSPAFKEIREWSAPQVDVFAWYRDTDIDPDKLLSPHRMELRDGTGIEIKIDPGSSYHVVAEDGRYYLHSDERRLEEVYFMRSPSWLTDFTSSGKPMASIAIFKPADNTTFHSIYHCEYFNTGEQCRYCNYVTAKDSYKKVGKVSITTPNPEDLKEVAERVFKERMTSHIGVGGGSLFNTDKEVELIIKSVNIIKKAFGHPNDTLPGNVGPQATTDAWAAKLYETGIETAGSNIEVWDPKLFAVNCPAKERYIGREEWLRRLENYLQYWGEGKVISSYVAGVEFAQPEGFKNIEDGLASTLEGFEWMISRGIVPKFHPWAANPGTLLSDRAADMPPVDYHLRLGLGFHDLMKTYGLYPHPTSLCYRCFIVANIFDFNHLMA